MSIWGISTSSSARMSVGSLLVVVLGLCTGCNRCDSTPPPGQTEVAPSPPERAPAPRELLFDVFVPKPARAWSALRDLAGPAAQVLPLNVGLMATRSLGLPLVIAGRIDADLPWVGAVLRSDGGGTSWVFAMHVQSGPELVAELTRGNQPTHRAVQKQGVTLLEKVDPTSQAHLAVVDNYLVAGSSEVQLPARARYLARSLAERKMPESPLSMVAERSQLRGAAVDWLENTWQAYRRDLAQKRESAQSFHGGRAPDFAEPAAVVDALDAWVQELASYARSSERLELLLEPSKSGALLNVELSPSKQGKAASWVDGIAVGDARGVLSLPAAVALALWTKSSLAERTVSAAGAHSGLKGLLGERLSEPDDQALGGALDDLAKGRGDELRVGFMAAPEPGLLVQGSVRDRARIAKALAALPSVLKMSVVSKPLESFVGRPTVVPSTALPGTRSVKLRLVPQGQASGPGVQLEAIWSSDDELYRWVCGAAPARGLFDLLRAPKATLKATQGIEQRLGAEVQASAVLLVHPGRLGLLEVGPGQGAMLVLVAGRRNGRARVKLDIPSLLVQSALASGFAP